ncbi:type IV toxin-antitoxin system AbiEi family antitoxin domain-containing protein [Nesterenkonia sp. Act20]|uniref:type IV toxin-antitoxin system AbiEi family antitoxin domain-containing protein n=1 Tax=Nesterenkonia sp. Act20 TaxID=1483432 RepID=UPI001C44616C|nr:type IV toxin-antitoxin system AbiEi family antitoxin domain-containing protein [Nesterenkonia sp. Act20]
MTDDSRAPIELLRSCWQPDDLHSATRLSALVASGQLLRVRRGVYVEAAAWVRSPSWVRAEIALAAMARRLPGALFCR